MNKAIFTVPLSADSRKKTWRKHLTEVRTEKQTGYAFQGEWLNAGEEYELPVDSFILCYDEPGSMKNWFPLVRVFQLQSDGNLDEVFYYEGGINQKSWALSVRDSIADLIMPKYVRIEIQTLLNEREKLLNRIEQIDDLLYQIKNSRG